MGRGGGGGGRLQSFSPVVWPIIGIYLPKYGWASRSGICLPNGGYGPSLLSLHAGFQKAVVRSSSPLFCYPPRHDRVPLADRLDQIEAEVELLDSLIKRVGKVITRVTYGDLFFCFMS